MAITSVGYDGSIDETQWAQMVPNVGAPHGVVSGANPPIILSSADRTVRLPAQVLYGWGVIDTLSGNTDVQASSVVSGSRWDTLVCRRDWQPTPGGTTSVVLVQGTATKAIASGLEAQPGTLADQPLALCRVTAGQSLMQEVVDLRPTSGKVWSFPTAAALLLVPAERGMFAYAVDTGHMYRASNTPAWVNLSNPGWTNFTLASGIERGTFGNVPSWRLHNGNIELRGIVQRTNGAAFNTAQAIATLPGAVVGVSPTRRPSPGCEFAVGASYTPTSAAARVEVGSDGVLQVLAPSSAGHTWVSLDGIFFAPAGS